jgi:ribonuclease HI
MNELTIYTDGAARGNPGPGGYGTILFWGDHRKRTVRRLSPYHQQPDGTDGRHRRPRSAEEGQSPQITVYSDSQYVVKAVEQGWLKNWIATNFKGGKKNKDLWLRFNDLAKKNNIRFVWVRGHADNPTTTAATNSPLPPPTAPYCSKTKATSRNPNSAPPAPPRDTPRHPPAP